MAQILSYDDWKVTYSTATRNPIRQTLICHANADTDEKVEALMQEEYNVYVALRQADTSI
jgi:hypothetical protein